MDRIAGEIGELDSTGPQLHSTNRSTGPRTGRTNRRPRRGVARARCRITHIDARAGWWVAGLIRGVLNRDHKWARFEIGTRTVKLDHDEAVIARGQTHWRIKEVTRRLVYLLVVNPHLHALNRAARACA